MQRTDFEQILDRTAKSLTDGVQTGTLFYDHKAFEKGVLDMIRMVAKDCGMTASSTFHKQAFPDIRVNGFGVEVKYTNQDTWSAVGNSIFEGMRDPDVCYVYVVMGKIGGKPEVRWGRYEDSISHVRVSHSPRFVLELDGRRSSLFDHLSVSYGEFSQLDDESKMEHIRDYSRNLLKDGERLWWLENTHTLPVSVRIYRTLKEQEKRKLRAEVSLLCPEVVQPRNRRGKYDNAGLYLITQHGVLAPHLRDLFSAGSVGARTGRRGHKYIIDSLKDIQQEIYAASQYLDERLFVEYWGIPCLPEYRIREWLRTADYYATDWKPSEELFTTSQSG